MIAASSPVNTVFQVVLVVILGLLAVAAVATLLLSAVIFAVSRLSGDAAPRTRRLLTKMALARSGAALHPASVVGDGASDEVTAGLSSIQAQDPAFDQIAIVEAARRALFLVFVMQTTGVRERLQQVTTADFWRSPVGALLTQQGDAQERIRALRERQTPEPTSTRKHGATIGLDFHAGAATLREVRPGDGGSKPDRVTLRIGYVGRGVITGSAADLHIAAHNKGLWEIALGGATNSAVASTGGLAQTEQRGYYDLEFERPVGSVTALGGEGRRCHNCGAPFASDLQPSCANCQVTRVTPEGEWLLARSWLVVPSPA